MNYPTVKILIISKSKNGYGFSTATTLSTGLYNSASHVRDYLSKTQWVDIKLVSVVDNNCIDREVTLFKPDIAIIEALWVVPEKFDVLKKLHPTVKWIVRIHSEVAFLAGEGTAFNWISGYLSRDSVYVAPNTERTTKDLEIVFPDRIGKILYLPNLYDCGRLPSITPMSLSVVDISCFGSIRIMKNHLTQAIAAIEFANRRGSKLRFHINATRAEGYSADNILKNLRAIFKASPNHELVEHEWLSQKDFKELIKKMDIGMQVSFTETFNMVSADMVTQGIPIVGSSAIRWLSASCIVQDETDSRDIVRVLEKVSRFKKSCVNDSYDNLSQESRKTEKIWRTTLTELVFGD